MMQWEFWLSDQPKRRTARSVFAVHAACRGFLAFLNTSCSCEHLCFSGGGRLLRREGTLLLPFQVGSGLSRQLYGVGCLEISFAAQVINIVVLRQAGAKGSSWHSFHLVVGLPDFYPTCRDSTVTTQSRLSRLKKLLANQLHCSCIRNASTLFHA